MGITGHPGIFPENLLPGQAGIGGAARGTPEMAQRRGLTVVVHPLDELLLGEAFPTAGTPPAQRRSLAVGDMCLLVGNIIGKETSIAYAVDVCLQISEIMGAAVAREQPGGVGTQHGVCFGRACERPRAFEDSARHLRPLSERAGGECLLHEVSSLLKLSDAYRVPCAEQQAHSQPPD
jgi:hypothetical protein